MPPQFFVKYSRNMGDSSSEWSGEEAATQTPAQSHLQEFQIFPSNWSEQHKLGRQRCSVSRPLSSSLLTSTSLRHDGPELYTYITIKTEFKVVEKQLFRCVG